MSKPGSMYAVSYDLFFIFCLIFIAINYITLAKKGEPIFCTFFRISLNIFA